MTSRIRTSLAEAMTQLKKGNVMAATSVIQRSLGIGSAKTRSGSSAAKLTFPDLQALMRRPVGSAVPKDLAPPSPPELPTPIDDPSGVSAKSPPRPLPTGKAAGFSSRTYHSNAGMVSYKLYVPATVAKQDLALVIMLHGCTQNADDFARGTGMNTLADEFGFIVAYPQQPRTANPQGCWNWFDDRHQHRGSGEPVLLAGLAQDLAREFSISASRTFAAGLSAGGAMADVLAVTYPDVFAAVGIHSGLPAGAATTMLSALAAMKGSHARSRRRGDGKGPFVRKIVFHGNVDTTVNAANGKAILDMSRPIRSDVAELTSDTIVNGRRVTRTTIQGAHGRPLTEHWVVHGAGHAWVGGHPDGSYIDTAGPDASREMVRFFLGR